MGVLKGCLIGFVLLSYSTSGIAKTIYDEFMLRQGPLTQNEYWEGKNLLVGDVIVPDGVELTLAPNAWVVYNNTDSHNVGQYANRPELIVNGTLTQTKSQPAKILDISSPQVQAILATYQTNGAVKVGGDAVSTKPLHKKIRQYKHHYITWWVVGYSLLLVLF